MRAWATLCGLPLALGLAGCPSLGAYQCERDEDCNRAGVAGACLADAACAYPETSGRCESGWARSPNAADAPGACIEDEPVGTSSGPTSSNTSTISATSTSSGQPTSNAAETIGPAESSTGALPCWQAEVQFPTAVFSPGAGLDGFPLWVTLDPWEGADLLASGDNDLRITTVNDEPVAYEREDTLDGRPALWIGLPTFEADETLQLRFTFGPELGTPDASELWTQRYAGVWHMDDVPTGLGGDLVRNSAVASETGTMLGSIQPEQRIAGVTGTALEFDGVDDIVEIAGGFEGELDAYTISMWFRVDSPAGDTRGSPFQRLNGDYFYPRCWHASDGSLGLACQHSVSGETSFLGSTMAVPEATMLHFAMVRDPSIEQTTLYVAGEQNNTTSDPAGGVLDTDAALYPFELGHGEWGTLLGAIDEVRVSAQVLSPARLRADYRSQTGALELAQFGALVRTTCPP